MNPTLEPLAELFRLNSTLFRNTLSGVTDEVGAARPNGQTNSVAFIAGHLVETRAWMARYLGGDEPAPFDGLLEHATRIEEIPVLPSLAAVGAAWEVVSVAVERRLDLLTESDLASPTSQRFPGVAPTILGGIAFLIQHESYHIGQLALLRKYFGLGPMSYR